MKPTAKKVKETLEVLRNTVTTSIKDILNELNEQHGLDPEFRITDVDSAPVFQVIDDQFSEVVAEVRRGHVIIDDGQDEHDVDFDMLGLDLLIEILDIMEDNFDEYVEMNKTK